MKINVRRGVFETNSSSVHSLTMMMKDEYDKFVNGDLFYIEWRYPYFQHIEGDFISKEELYKIAKENEFDGCMEDTNKLIDFFDGSVEDYDNFGGDCEWFEDTFTTPNGDTVVAFGYYGYDS